MQQPASEPGKSQPIHQPQRPAGQTLRELAGQDCACNVYGNVSNKQSNYPSDPGRMDLPAKLARTIALLLFFLVFELADPFGLSEATRRAADTFQTAITAPFHGADLPRAAGAIAVVEIGPRAQAAQRPLTGVTWPIPLEAHARWLDLILDAEPAAIFIDVDFQERAAGSALHELVPFVERAKAKGVLVLAAAGLPGRSLPPPLQGLEAVNAWNADTLFYPLLLGASAYDADSLGPADHAPAGLAPAGRQAADHGDPGHGAAGHETAGNETAGHVPNKPDTGAATAAFALYDALCTRGALPAFCSAAPDHARFAQPMTVRWSTRPDPLQSRLNAGCPARVDDFGRFLDAAWTALVWISRLTEHARSTDDVCRPLLTIAAELLHEDQMGTAAPATDLLRGRVVFYGMQLEGEHDVVQTPTMGLLPGVQLHAQAFENLLAYGPGYFGTPKEYHIGSLGPAKLGVSGPELLLASIWVVTCFALVWAPQKAAHDSGAPGWRLWAAGPEAALAVLAIDLAQRAGPGVLPSQAGSAVQAAGGLALLLLVLGHAWSRRRRDLGVWLEVAGAAVAFGGCAVVIASAALIGGGAAVAAWLTMLAIPYCMLAGLTGFWLHGTQLSGGSLGRVVTLLLGCAWVGVLNELYLRLPGTDWVALVLLYFAVGHATSNHGPGFVPSVARGIERIIRGFAGLPARFGARVRHTLVNSRQN